MKVWMPVYEVGYESTQILGIFTSIESAEKCLANAIIEMSEYEDVNDYFIREYEVLP